MGRNTAHLEQKIESLVNLLSARQNPPVAIIPRSEPPLDDGSNINLLKNIPWNDEYIGGTEASSTALSSRNTDVSPASSGMC